MYDTLSLWLPTDKACNTDLLAELPLRFSSYKETYDSSKSSLPVISGSIDNFFVKVREQGVFITGSLNKYFHHTNVRNLSYFEAIEALSQFEDALELKLDEAAVLRIDFSSNFTMTQPIRCYFPFFGDLPRYQKSTYENSTITYSNGRKSIIFYDKIKEQSAKHLPVPNEFENQNIIRYESRFLRRLPEIFGKHVTVATLKDKLFYRNLLMRYQSEYNRIEKMRRIILSNSYVNGTKDIERELMRIGIAFLGGEAGLNQIINDSRKTWIINNPVQITRLKAKIRAICNIPGITEPCSLMEELTQKIHSHVSKELALIA